MLKQSDAFNAAFASDSRTLTAKLTVGGRSFNTDDLTSIDYDSAAMTGEQMGIGSTYENSVKIAFASLVEGIKPQDKVTVSIGIQLPDSSFEYASLGVFYVDDEITMDRNNNLTSISAVDGMCWLEGTYNPKVTVPTTLVAMALDIANQTGVTIDQDNFSKLPIINISELPVKQTYRTVLGQLAMLLPGFVLFNRQGELALRGINGNNLEIKPKNYEFQGLTVNENPYSVAGITVNFENNSNAVSTDGTTIEKASLHVGSTTGSQLTLQNNFFTEQILNDVWSSLEEVQYYPYSLNWFGNPALEAGDWLTVYDVKGNKYIVPNSSFTMNFTGGLSAVSSTGETVTSSTNWNYHGTLTQTIRNIVRQLNSVGTYTYYTPTEPTSPHEGDLWYKPNGDLTEFYIYTNGKWLLMVSDMTGSVISAEVDKAQKDIELARQVANDAVAQANNNAAAIQTKVGSDQYNSMISQLTGDINLRVTQGDVINQLNMEAGQTLIQSGKILLDAPSVIFSGSAFIPDAAIKNLSAGKLTAGTLDANIINVINFNANSITAGTLSGKNLSLNLETGIVSFESGHIQNQNGYFDINIDNGTITSSSGGFGTLQINKGDLLYYEGLNNTGLTGKISMDAPYTAFNTAMILQSNAAMVMTVNNTFISDITGSHLDKYTSLQMLPDKIQIKAINKSGGILSGDIGLYSCDIEGNTNTSIWLNRDRIQMSGNILLYGSAEFKNGLVVGGDLSVKGDKQAVYVTRDGVRATPAYETTENYLGDIGENITDDDRKVVIPIDGLFGDIVNTSISYQVFLQSYSSAHVWVSSRDEASFTVQSELPNTSFTWEIKAKRRGYENNRLKLTDIDPKDIAEMEGYNNE